MDSKKKIKISEVFDCNSYKIELKNKIQNQSNMPYWWQKSKYSYKIENALITITMQKYSNWLSIIVKNNDCKICLTYDKI